MRGGGRLLLLRGGKFRLPDTARWRVSAAAAAAACASRK
jgi:hypothetical protein